MPKSAPLLDVLLPRGAGGAITVSQGEYGEGVITASLVTGGAQPVTLACTGGLPVDASCSFSPATGYPTFSSSLTLSVDSSTSLGSYDVVVTGTGGGRTYSTIFTLTVTEGLKASISANATTGPIPFSLAFISEVKGGRLPYTYAWDFGDGSSSFLAGPNHTYGAVGNYSVSLAVSDGGGVSLTRTLRVSAIPPLQLSVSVTPFQGVQPLGVTFSTMVQGGMAPYPYTYTWTFGDGGMSSDANPGHTYQEPGNFTATLWVTDSLGYKKMAQAPVHVLAPLTTHADADSTGGGIPLLVRFIVSVTGGVGPYSFGWDFGDGSNSSDQNPSHTFRAAGVYSVTLMVRDRGGQTVTNSITVTTKENTSSFTSPIVSVAAVGAVVGIAVVGLVLARRRKR